jgi:ABC-type transport system involved in multi-copper enzyme maturation permease subunit
MVDMNAQNWAKLGLFLLITVVYLAVFFSLGSLISCLTRHSSTALVISLFAWAMLVFLIPNMGNILARQLVRIPTVQQIELKREHIMIKDVVEAEYDGQPGHMTWAERGKRHRRENAQINEDYRNCFNRLVAKSQNITRFSPAAAFTFLTTDFMGTGVSDERRLRRAVLQYKSTSQDRGGKRPTFRYQRSSVKEVERRAEEIERASHERSEEEVDKLWNDLNTKAAFQTKLAKNLACISPLADFMYLARDLTGTGLRSLEHIKRTKAEYEDLLRSYMERKQDDARQMDPKYDSYSLLDVRDRPRFVYKEEPLKDKLNEVLPYWGILVLFNVLFFAGAFAGFMRYDVR